MRNLWKTPAGPTAGLAAPPELLADLIDRARRDPAFKDIQRRFAATGIEHWLGEDEKALHFGIGAFAPGEGRIVEIGTYQGGSACFLAAGIARRGRGRLTCVDPHLGGPPWLGMAPSQRTLDRFRDALRACGLVSWVEPCVGDSIAVASIWPAEPIDAVFIDGDHSFHGALGDFECWAPKVRPGGLVLIDDADDPALAELRDMIEFVRTLKSIKHAGTVGGVAVFRVSDVGAWERIAELGEAEARRGILRAWEMSSLHRTSLPTGYGRSRKWSDNALDTAYQLCYLARCGPGPYGFTPEAAETDRELLAALSHDRADGEVVPADTRQFGFRAIAGRPEEAAAYAPCLQAGGVFIARDRSPDDQAGALRTRGALIAAGLEGCGWQADVHWGVWRPHHLSPDALLEYAAASLAGPGALPPQRRLPS